jgi:TRAP-type mannitol/chloroaromatic compound transport system substrate-binding protein
MSRSRSGGMRAAVAGAMLLAAGLHGVDAQAQQAAPKTLNMQASWPASSTFMTNFTQFADRVNKTSGGRLQIKTSAAGTIVPAFEVTDATHKGVIDGAHTWSGYLIGKHPAAVLFTGGPGGPFGMDLFDHLGWFYDGGGQQLMDEWFEKIIQRDIISLPVMPFTPQMFGWFKQPFKGWADLKGRKIRAVGMNAQLLNSAGAAVVSMPGGEIVPSAQRGVIDAAEWCCPAEDVKLGFHSVWKYYYMPSMHEMTEVADLIISKATFKALAPDLQEIIKMAATETYLRWWLTYVRENSKALSEMREKQGVNVRRTPPEVLIKQLETWDAVREKFAKEDPFFAKVMESQRVYAANVVPGRMAMFPAYSFAADYYWRKKPAAAPAAAAPKSNGKPAAK